MMDWRNKNQITLGRLRPTDHLIALLEKGPIKGEVVRERKEDGCFVEDTPILMSNCTHKSIRDIQEGDWIKSFDKKRRRLVNAQVAKVFDNGLSSEWIELTIESEGEVSKIICTPQHPFYSEGKWIEAEEMLNRPVLLDPIKESTRRKKYPRLNEAFLVAHYIRKQESLDDVATLIGCSRQAVVNALSRYKIRTRTVKEGA